MNPTSFQKPFPKIEEKEALLNSFYEASIAMLPKPEKDITRKLQTNITYEYRCKNPQQKILANQIQQYNERIIHLDQVGFIPGRQGVFFICKSINVICHINKLKRKNHTILSMEAEKAFDKIQDPFMIKTLQKMGIEGTHLDVL